MAAFRLRDHNRATPEGMMDDASFGAWLTRRRKALGLSRAELARRVSCATVTLRKIEEDARRPSPELAALLAEYLAVAPAERPTFVPSRAESCESTGWRPPTNLCLLH